jgi:hypothetical protein
MSFTIDIQDRATPAIRGALGELQLAGVKPAIGRAVVRLVQQHFLRLNASRANPLGGPRSNFYAQAARSTRYDVLTDGVLVSVSQAGIRQRREGGEIVPRNVKYLTIPAIAEAFGRRAAEFDNLVIMWRRIGGQTRPVALVEATPFTRGIKTDRVGGRVFFWLVKSVTQRADPAVLPADDELRDTAIGAAQAYFERALKRLAEGTK